MSDFSYQVREHVAHRAIELGLELDVEAVVEAVLAESSQGLNEALTVADEIVHEVGGRSFGEFAEDSLFFTDSDWD